MNIIHRIGNGKVVVALTGTLLVGACAVETGSEELGTEMLAETSSQRTTAIHNKFLANQSLLVSEIPNSTSQFSNGAKRDYTGAGNNSSIYYGDAVNRAQIVMGFIRGKYLAKSAQAGVLGYPTSDEFSTAFGTGRCNFFQTGRILWKNGASQAYESHGNIDALYTLLGLEWGGLGFTTSDQYTYSSSYVNRFEYGRIYMTGGAPRPVLTGTNPNAKLSEMNQPRITNVVLSLLSNGRACISAKGWSFPPGAIVNFATSSYPAVRPGGSSATVLADGTFTYAETAPLCTDVYQTVNNVATVWARTSTGNAQAIAAVNFNYASSNIPLSSLP